MSENPYAPGDNSDPIQIEKRSKFQIRWIINGLIVVFIFLVLAAFILPEIYRIRVSSTQNQRQTQIRQIGIAILNYEYVYKSLPPAYTVDESGRRLHSWRALILPYMDEKGLADKIDFSKPWDDPANAVARSKIPEIYRNYRANLQPGFTAYLAVVAENSAFQPGRGVRLDQITDGTENTLAVYEANIPDAVEWMEPKDADLNQFLAFDADSKLINSEMGCRNVFMLDCAVRCYWLAFSKDEQKAIVTIDAGDDPGYLPGS